MMNNFEQFRKSGDYLVHSGSSRQPHFRLTSGLHSNAYFNASCLLNSDFEIRSAAKDLLKILRNSGVNIQKIDRTVGPRIRNKSGVYSTRLIESMALEIEKETKRPCHWTSAVKVVESDTSYFSPGNSSKLSGIHNLENCLIVDDVFTSGKSIALTAEMIELYGGRVVPCAVTLLNRSSEKKFLWKNKLDITIHSIMSIKMETWTEDECPLCKKGGIAICPREDTDKLAVWY